MPDSSLVKLADACLSHLSSQSLSMSYTTKKLFLPDFEREDLSGVEVSIFPQGQQSSISARDSEQYIYTLNVVIRMPITPSATPDLDAALYFTEQLKDSLRLTSLAGCSYQGIQNDPAYDLEALAERNEIISIITATYLEIR